MIRRYKVKDLNELLGAWYSASKVGHPFLSKAFFEQERKNIAEFFLPKSETWVYEQAGKVIAFISLHDNEVGGLFVDAAYQRQAIGRALLDHVKNSRAYLELEVFEDNQIGRNFYKNYGFKQIDKCLCEETGFVQLRLRLE